MTAALKIPKLCPARHPKKVAMPRFRNEAQPQKVTLTEAVLRVLKRASHSPKSFGVFAIDGKPVLSNVESALFKRMEKRWPEKLVAIYEETICVAHVIEDLREHFSDEVGA